MKKLGKYIISFLVLILIFVTMLLLACSFPSSLIKENVQKSSELLNKEGNRKICFIVNKFQYQEFDNYSDSLMINTAYSIDNKTPMYSAFTAKKDYIPGVTKKIYKDVIGELKSSSKYERHNEVGELEDTIKGVGEESFEYAKYWHGYLSVLRPLLLFFDYGQIRILLTSIFAILAILVINEISKKNRIIAVLYLLALLSVDYFYIGISLINSIMFLIMMISSFILIKRFEKIKDFGFFFFIVGMFVGFLGLLDVPLITLGGLLILYFVFKNGEGSGDFKELVKFSLLWVLGYFLTWMIKWILMDVIYNRNLIITALNQILYRSIGGKIHPLVAIYFNLINIIIPFIIFGCIDFYIWMKYCININKNTRRRGRIFLIISMMPILWYLLLPSHSAYHYFFTYRLFFITMFSFTLWLYYICGESEKR